MKKRAWIRRIFCSLLLLVLPLAANAKPLYSLAVYCRYEQRAVAGVELDLYRAGSLDNRGCFVPAEGFGSDSVLPESWDALAALPSQVPGKPSQLPQTGQDWQGVCVLGLFGLGLVCGAVMTRKHTRRIIAIGGALCILGALGFVGSNLHRSTESGRQAGAVLEELLPVVYANAQEATAVPPQTLAPETEPTAPVPEMPTQTINGWDYIGYLSIPSLELTLPIQSQWSYEGFRVAPGRFAGSTYSKDLVLAAHNYPQHFGHIGDLQPGDTVCFTDMDGHVTHYRVAALETLAPEDVEGMLSGEYDLTLFTCTVGGKSRVTVRCTEA